MSKEREPASAATEGARRAAEEAPEERRDGRGRWSAKRKFAAVFRLLRGEDLETVSRELGVTAATLSRWRQQITRSKGPAISPAPCSSSWIWLSSASPCCCRHYRRSHIDLDLLWLRFFALRDAQR